LQPPRRAAGSPTLTPFTPGVSASGCSISLKSLASTDFATRAWGEERTILQKTSALTPPLDAFPHGAKPLNLRDSRAIHEAPPRDMSDRSLQAQNLHLWRGDRHVLRGLSFSVAAGECLLVSGPNGTGKTSLLRSLSGLMYLEGGRVVWRGKAIRDDLHGYHDDLAYIGHEPPLKVDLTATENLRYWIGVRRRLAARDIQEALDRVGAANWSDRPVRTLSAGQKRRVALAGLILMAAPLWLLDEPTTNLDTQGQQLVSTLIADHLAGGGVAVAAIHHDLGIAAPGVRRLELAGE
jgi:heme exporter protein A